MKEKKFPTFTSIYDSLPVVNKETGHSEIVNIIDVNGNLGLGQFWPSTGWHTQMYSPSQASITSVSLWKEIVF